MISATRVRLYAMIGIYLIIIQIGGYIGLSVHRRVPAGRDAWSYVAAARMLAAGSSPYTTNLSTDLPDGPDVPSPYLYPPLLAWLLVPIAALPLPIVILSWFVFVSISHMLLIAALRAVVGWRCAAIAVLLWLPTWQGLYYGQINALVAICLTLGVLSLQKHQDGASGLWLTLGTFSKITPIMVLLTLLAQRRWRIVLFSTMFAIIIVGITLPFVPLHLWIDGFLFAFTVTRGNPWYTSWGAAIGHLPGVLGAVGPLILAIGATVLTLWRGRSLPLPLAIAASIVVPLLVARTTWEHHAVITLPALAILWMWSRRGRWLAGIAWGTIGLIGALAIPLALTVCWLACLWPAVLGSTQAQASWAKLDTPDFPRQRASHDSP